MEKITHFSHTSNPQTSISISLATVKGPSDLEVMGIPGD